MYYLLYRNQVGIISSSFAVAFRLSPFCTRFTWQARSAPRKPWRPLGPIPCWRKLESQQKVPGEAQVGESAVCSLLPVLLWQWLPWRPLEQTLSLFGLRWSQIYRKLLKSTMSRRMHWTGSRKYGIGLSGYKSLGTDNAVGSLSRPTLREGSWTEACLCRTQRCKSSNGNWPAKSTAICRR